MVVHVQASHGVSELRSCLALGVDRSSLRYVSHRPDQAPLMLCIRDLAATRTRYGYFRIDVLLRREGWFVNHKRVYRLYWDDCLSLRLSLGWLTPIEYAAAAAKIAAEWTPETNLRLG